VGLREREKYTPRYLYSFVSSVYVSPSTHLLDLSIHFPTTAAHDCLIWFPSSAAQKDLLESLQYQAAKITIRTKMNIPKCALLAELGWEPINAFLDRQRVKTILSSHLLL
jgi:hypothetical protein